MLTLMRGLIVVNSVGFFVFDPTWVTRIVLGGVIIFLWMGIELLNSTTPNMSRRNR
jgi:diacylglycerol kinase